ncbi:copper resistance protein CopC [Alishewanella sp. BS5-314]|uniref:copper resistance CopC family protein n=1 Tax=Alishewanella sp. BS5-314 TaxID=2755587 RepID=UPI0021BB4CFA|nr:copper resistance CopC family protein [Alishewanella sp. BS5-314]MCT8124750.1 copper resistance protein CopC [Alishewanella sp. BS5-314]
MKTLASLMAALFFFALQSNAALAHTPLMFSIPAKDAVLTKSPKVVMLHFGDPVRMLSLELTLDEEAIEFGFRRNTEATDHIEFTLPALKAGSYQFSWAAIGADGHRVSGVIAFSIDPNVTESSPGKQPEAGEHQHHHARLLTLQSQGI